MVCGGGLSRGGAAGWGARGRGRAGATGRVVARCGGKTGASAAGAVGCGGRGMACSRADGGSGGCGIGVAGSGGSGCGCTAASGSGCVSAAACGSGFGSGASSIRMGSGAGSPSVGGLCQAKRSKLPWMAVMTTMLMIQRNALSRGARSVGVGVTLMARLAWRPVRFSDNLPHAAHPSSASAPRRRRLCPRVGTRAGCGRCH